MSNPYQSPEFAADQAVLALVVPDREKMRRVANRQQFVLYALLANIVINIAFVTMPPDVNPMLRLTIFILAISVVIATMIAALLLSWELYNVAVGIVCAILMPVPCIALLT